MDPQSRNKIFENIEALHAEGRTIIYTTHYMEEAVRLCERIAIVDAGRLLALGTVGELLAHTEVRRRWWSTPAARNGACRWPIRSAN